MNVNYYVNIFRHIISLDVRNVTNGKKLKLFHDSPHPHKAFSYFIPHQILNYSTIIISEIILLRNKSLKAFMSLSITNEFDGRMSSTVEDIMKCQACIS